MRKLISVILILIIVSLKASALDISATSAVLYEPVTKRIIFEKNSKVKLPMASTTKIATCITAIENGNLSDVVTTSKKAADTEGSSIWLETGEKMTLEHLLYGLMLSSGNDAAVAIAEHISGTTAEFSKLMNNTAFKAGVNNTNFTNPSGLDDEQHYTTAEDLAKITAYSLNNSVFAEIVSTKEKSISFQGREWDRKLKNHNKLLWWYDGCIGVKTGFTKKSGRCLVSAASRNNIRLITVTLKAPDDWNDHTVLLDYGFSLLSLERVVEKGRVAGIFDVTDGVESTINCLFEETVDIPKLQEDEIEIKTVISKDITAPVKKGMIVGYADVLLNGNKIGRVNLIAEKECKKIFVPTFGYYFEKILKNMFKSKNDVF